MAYSANGGGEKALSSGVTSASAWRRGRHRKTSRKRENGEELKYRRNDGGGGRKMASAKMAAKIKGGQKANISGWRLVTSVNGGAFFVQTMAPAAPSASDMRQPTSIVSRVENAWAGERRLSAANSDVAGAHFVALAVRRAQHGGAIAASAAAANGGERRGGVVKTRQRGIAVVCTVAQKHGGRYGALLDESHNARGRRRKRISDVKIKASDIGSMRRITARSFVNA
jgi:hypothetical protein